MKPLWPDAKIDSLTVQNTNNLDPDARWMHEQIVTDMRNDYERALSVRNGTIEQLQAAQQWQPVTDAAQPTEGVELIDPYAADDRRLYVEDDGTTLVFSIEGGALECMFMLPEGYAICRKVQPAA